MQDDNLVQTLDNCFVKFIENLQSNNCQDHILKAAKNFHKNYSEILLKVLSFEDTRFLAHGDFWSNNVMYNKSNGKMSLF